MGESDTHRSHLAARPSKLGPLDRALKCGLQGARSPLRVPIVLDARLLEPPCTTRMHGRAGRAGQRGSTDPDMCRACPAAWRRKSSAFRVPRADPHGGDHAYPDLNRHQNIALCWRVVVRRALAPRNAEILLRCSGRCAEDQREVAAEFLQRLQSTS
jgi:hypothetical protein